MSTRNCTSHVSYILAGLATVACSTGQGATTSTDDVADVGRAAQALAETDTTDALAERARRREALRAYFEERRSHLQIVVTTESPYGQILDWIPRASQFADGKVPPLPPEPVLPPDVRERVERAKPSPMSPSAAGPEGTVPVVYLDVDRIPDDIELPANPEDYLGKAEAPVVPGINGNHHYAMGGYTTFRDSVFGTDGFLTYHYPTVWKAEEFSLGQLAVVSYNLPPDDEIPTQTVEAGWIRYPQHYGDWHTHFFTSFTVDRYNQQTGIGDNKGCFDMTCVGWVQMDGQHNFPGNVMLVGPSPGFERYLYVKYWYPGWWLWDTGTWVGYYPASLFSTAGLRNSADTVKWYGELVDSYSDNVRTQTDMGNGQFATSHTAIMKNLRVQKDINATNIVKFKGEGAVATDPACWSVEGHFTDTGPFQSHFYYGGPGAGGACN